MEVHLIIKRINSDERGENYWRSTCELNCKELQKILGEAFPNLTDPQYSNLRKQNGRTLKKLARVLETPEIIKKLEVKLRCDGLFLAQSNEEVDQLLGATISKFSNICLKPAGQALIAPSWEVAMNWQLSEKELEAAKGLGAFIKQFKTPIVQWTNSPPPGASVIAYVAAAQIAAEHQLVYIVKPYKNAAESFLMRNGEDAQSIVPYALALNELRLTLGLDAHCRVATLVHALIQRRCTLIVLNPETLAPRTAQASEMCTLLKELQKTNVRDCNFGPVVVLVGDCRERVSLLNKFVHNNSHNIMFGVDDNRIKDEFFERQWRRYCILRGRKVDAAAGSSRLKRGRNYFNGDTEGSCWPIAVRVQAFFASNHKTYSYFDPTAGWNALSGIPIGDLPLDVLFHLEDVVRRLMSIQVNDKRNPQIRALQWCSTALYWLTNSAASELGSKLRPTTTLDTFQSACQQISDNTGRLIETQTLENGEVVYKLELGLRAVVQEWWKNKRSSRGLDVNARAQVHYRIARRLFDSSNDKHRLQHEFPVVPHWGRSRLHFLSETIRHLVRACETSKPLYTVDHTFAAEGHEAFPSPPQDKNHGCDPYETINYCFGILFWQELNGQRSNTHMLNRKLALQHGAYHLTAEILQLISMDGQLGQPHQALNPVYYVRYMREVAYAQLDLGDLQSAMKTLSTLINSLETSDQDTTALIDAQLDLTVVLASMDDLGQAQLILVDAENRLFSLCDAISQDRVNALQYRILASKSNLAYLNGNFNDALSQCISMAKFEPAAMVRDAAHTYIATLGSLSDEPSNLETAHCICLGQLFSAESRGLHHEALGFRIALGHILRKQGLRHAAEVTLDGVYNDVMQYGCSERTYLAMLLEAGRVLVAQKRYERAYAAYLRLCLERAKTRGYARFARTAARFCENCLREMLSNMPTTGLQLEEVQNRLRAKGAYLEEVKRNKNIDPLFSFDAPEAEIWATRLQTQASLLVQLKEVTDLAQVDCS